jgi:hypothetical protein
MGLQYRQNLALFNAIPFFYKNLGNMLLLIKRKVCVADIDISVDLKLGGGRIVFHFYKPPAAQNPHRYKNNR